MKILIAEDDAVSRRLLRGHLEKWGHEVAEATDGAEAWDTFIREEIAPGGGFPIVVVDWMMPLLDGLELVERIRARQLPRYVYILMLTAKNQKHDIVTGMDAGADDYLTKPFDKDELRARLQAGQRILDLHAAVTRSEKSASVGRLAVGVAGEIAVPIADVVQSLIDLRQDANAVLDALSPQEASVGAATFEPDAPAAPAPRDIDVQAVRSSLGPRFVAAEQKLNRVRDLVRSLRDFARLEDVPVRPLAVAPLITDTLSMMRQEFSSREIAAIWNVPAEPLPHVTGNAGKLKRAIYNLLSVLAESTDRERSIQITAGLEDGALAIHLKGGLPGLPAASIKNLFEPFSRVGEPLNAPRATLHSGLGLPVAFSIIREHGGTLEAIPATTGNATAFHIKLPTTTP